MNWNKLAQPFHYYSGEKALLLGLPVSLLASFLAYQLDAHFNGTFNLKFVQESVTSVLSFAEPFINVLIISLLFGFYGMLTKKGFRWVDVIGYNLAARTPILFIVLLMGSLGITRESSLAMIQSVGNENITATFGEYVWFSLLSLPFLIANIYLVYHANATVFSLKKWKGGVLFTGLLIATEIALYFFYSTLYNWL